MRQVRLGAETFGLASGETLHLHVSEPGECVSLADFASRTILACSLVGYEVVTQAPPRTLAELDRAGWVAEAVRQHASVELPTPAACPLFALVEKPDRLELALGPGPVYVAFCWDIDREWRARHAEPYAAADRGLISE